MIFTFISCSPGVPQSFQTASEMCKFVTMMIFSCSALHAAVNFSQVYVHLLINGQRFSGTAFYVNLNSNVLNSFSRLHVQLDFNLWIPNTPAAMSRPPSQTKNSVSEEELFSFLPEVNSSCHVLSVLALLSQPAIDFVSVNTGLQSIAAWTLRYIYCRMQM